MRGLRARDTRVLCVKLTHDGILTGGAARRGIYDNKRIGEGKHPRGRVGGREALLFDPGSIARVSGPPRSVGVTRVATPIRLMGTNIIIAASSSLSIQMD